MPQPKLLVTGASGFLGSWLCELAQSDWQVIGLYHRKKSDAERTSTDGMSWVQADLRQTDRLGMLVDRLAPDAVVHLAAISNTTLCQEDPVETAKLNVGAAVSLAQVCALRSLPFVFTSTDLVFDGCLPPYQESDPVNPSLEYGQQKAWAEAGVMKYHPDALVVRLPLMFGFGKVAANNFMTRILSALEAREPIRLFQDEIRNPLSAQAAAEGILLALRWAQERQHRGLVHLAGPEAVSRYELGLKLAAAKGYDAENLLPCCQDEVSLIMPRPKNVCLDGALARELGFKPASLAQQLAS